MDVGVISLSVEFAESYSEKLEKNGINVIQLTMESLDQELTKLDAVIICENSETDTAHTCSILLKLKKESDAFVWVFSSNYQKVMRTLYLQLGAVGIISEDCDEEELLLIIFNSLSKRVCGADKAKILDGSSSSNATDENASSVLQLIPRNHSVKINGQKEIPLTRLEYNTMELLHKHMNTAVTYKELFEEVWNEKFQNQNYRVANLIFHLREKIEEDSMSPRFIHTVRSKGYMLVD